MRCPPDNNHGRRVRRGVAAMNVHFNVPDATFKVAEARARAWFRIVAAVGEMRGALDYRIWREDPADTHLEADCQTWCELTHGLTDFLKARRLV